ncbi:MAG: fibronectin type III-like domain-contianing protein [Saprospiraceae bacterium]|nr:fibronectin type III-like domain-contianing protein [Saprospiraceae bacterium]
MNYSIRSIPKGEQKTITFEISESDLRFYNSKLEYISEAGTFKVFVGGNSRDVLEQEFELIK